MVIYSIGFQKYTLSQKCGMMDFSSCKLEMLIFTCLTLMVTRHCNEGPTDWPNGRRSDQYYVYNFIPILEVHRVGLGKIIL